MNALTPKSIAAGSRGNTFFVTGGTLPLQAGSYVVRHADADLHAYLTAGEYCYVLTTRQMGKSSLMVRTAVRLREEGASVAVLDLTAVGQNLSADQWYDGLLNRLGRQLDIEDELEAFYIDNARLGPLQRFMEAIERVILHGPKASSFAQVVIFVDEIDAVRSLPFSADEFFAAIRECFNRRATDPAFKRLTFCLLGVATPADLIDDSRMSPFNIGKRIVLTDFTLAEAAPLAEGLLAHAGGDGPTENGAAREAKSNAAAHRLLERVLYWTNGHPYMTQRLCRAVADAVGTNRSHGSASGGNAGSPNNMGEETPSPAFVDRQCASLFFSKDARDNDDNLAFVRNRLLRSGLDTAAVLDLYRKVRTGGSVPDDETSELISLLRLSGIVTVRDGKLAVRNRIYARVFDTKWITANIPGAEIERQRKAFQAGALRSALLGGIVTAAMAGLTIYSFKLKREADQSAKVAHDETTFARINAQEAKNNATKALESEKRAQESAKKATEEGNRAGEFGDELLKSNQQLIAAQHTAETNYHNAVAAAARATRAEGVERLETKRLDRIVYDATMDLVQREYEAHEYERMQALLNQTKQAEDRGFEWRFWQGLCPLEHAVSAHTGEVLCAASSPDGKAFVTGGTDRTVVVCDAATGRTLKSWKEDGDVRAAAFSPDGHRIAVGLSGNGQAGRAVIRAADSGKALVTLATDRAVWDIAFSHNGKMLATNGDRVQTWDGDTGVAEQDYGPGGPTVVFSPDDTRICYSRWAESGKPAAVEVLDLGEGMVSFALAGQTMPGQVRALAWSSDGSKIATGGDDRIVRLWDAASGKLIRPLAGHSDGVITASFSPDGKRLLTSSLDDEARVWELDSEQDNPRAIIAPSANPRARPPLRDLRLFSRENRMLFKHARQAVFSSDGRRIATGSYSGMVRIWNAAPPASYLVLEGGPIVSLDHTGAVAFAPDNRQIVSAIDSPFATVWDAQTGARRWDLRGHSANVSALAFFPDSTRIVSAGWDGAVRIWTAPRRSYSIQGHKGNATCVAVSNNGRIVASGGEDGAVIVWDTRTQKRVCLLSIPGAIAHGIAISPDGAKIAVAQTDNKMAGKITLWDAVTGKMLRTIASLPTRILAVRFSPDGTRILGGVDDRTAKIWDLETGKLQLTLSGHNSGVNSVAFSSDGRRVVTGSFDTTAKLWDARTGREILTLHHPTFVVGVALSRDGRRIVTACEDGSTRVWTAE